MFRLVLRARRFALVRIAIGAMLAVGVLPIGVSAAPSVVPLNPEPPDFYSCRVVGDGTICRAHTVEPYADEPTGIVCGSGGVAVELLDSGVRDVRATRWYDGDGNLTRRLRTFLFRDAHLTNPATGRTLDYSQHNTDDELLAVPGDLDSVTWTGHGHVSITAPGFGAVWLEAGRAIVGPDGEIDALSGVSRLRADDLCAALGTPTG